MVDIIYQKETAFRVPMAMAITSGRVDGVDILKATNLLPSTVETNRWHSNDMPKVMQMFFLSFFLPYVLTPEGDVFWFPL